MIGQIAGIAASLAAFWQQSAKHQAAADRYASRPADAPLPLEGTVPGGPYSGGQGALNDALATGAFTGSTCRPRLQLHAGITGMGAFGDRALGLGSSFMDTGQGLPQNAQEPL